MQDTCKRLVSNLKFCAWLGLQIALIIGPIVAAVAVHWSLIGMLVVTVSIVLTMHGLPAANARPAEGVNADAPH